MFDGRENFSVNRYWAQPYDNPVAVGSNVMVLFSMKVAQPKNKAESFGLKNMKKIFLNVLGVVVLAGPSDDFCPEVGADPDEVHGVDRLPRLADHVAVGSDDEEENLVTECW